MEGELKSCLMSSQKLATSAERCIEVGAARAAIASRTEQDTPAAHHAQRVAADPAGYGRASFLAPQRLLTLNQP